MRAATVYASAPSNGSDREGLIFAEVQRALLAMTEVDCHVVPPRHTDVAAREPARGTPSMPVIALGPSAHVALADASKRTLIAGDLDLEGDGDDAPIEQLIWSSINTVTMVALGEPAWQSIQLLPVGQRRSLRVPPVSLCRADTERPSVLVIDHQATAARALALVEALDRASLRVRYAGPPPHGGARHGAWADAGWIHIHVGEHTLDSEMLRLVDSWQSGRPTIQLLQHVRSISSKASAELLSVNDRQDGFVCVTENEVVALCRDLLDDPVLRDRVVAVGRSSAAPYHEAWRTVAEALLA